VTGEWLCGGARGEIMRARRLISASGRPLNFTVRQWMKGRHNVMRR